MKKLTTFFIVLLFCYQSQAQQANRCAGALKTGLQRESLSLNEASDLLEKIRNLEKTIDALRNDNSANVRSTTSKLRHKADLLEYYLELKDADSAIDLFRQTFRDVELSYYQISLKKQIDRETLKKFGENYGEYIHIRKLLEKINEKEAIHPLAPTAKKVLSNLGARSIAIMFPELSIPAERPNISQISEVFRIYPQALIYKLKKDLYEERVLQLSNFAYSLLHIEKIKSTIFKLIPDKYLIPLTEFIGLSYNSYVLKKYLNDIERVLEFDGSPRRKLDLLIDTNAKYVTKDELLVTFARMTSQSEQWRELKNIAKEASREDARIKVFYERMENVEVEAIKKYGELPRFESFSMVDRIVSMILPVSTMGYLYLHDSPWIAQSIQALRNFILP